MSRRDSRPWGPGGDDDAGDRPQASTRPWGGRVVADLPSVGAVASPGTGTSEFRRPFGGSGWRGEPQVPDPGPVDSGVDDGGDLDEESVGKEGGGPRRRRAEEAPSHPRRPLSALGSNVRVVRDASGVPHLSAKSERDAWAALGWCMAQDRRAQLDLLRRLAFGRSAEILGSAFVAHDALVRTAGVARRAALAASRLPGASHDVIASFAAGVNAALADPTGTAREGAPTEPWTIADTLAIEILRAFATSLRAWPAKLLHARALASAGPRRAEWVAGEKLAGATDEARLRAWSALDLSLLDLVAGLPIDAGMDGAAWASDGPGGCELGVVLRASPALLPALYEAVVETPTLRLAGCAPLGVPAFLVGRTRDLAWAGLPAIVDDCDVVMEELDGIGNRRTPAGWEKLASRRETIRVRDAEPVVVEVLETRRGPLVSHLARQFAGLAADPRVPALALHWGAGTVFSSAAAWAGIAHASDVASAGRAAAAFEHSTQPVRLVVADRAGRVAAGTFGSLPVREAACRLPMLGWKGEGGWTGVRPASVPGDAWSQVGPGHGVASASEAPPTVRAVEDSRAARPTETRFGEAAPGFDAADPFLREILPVLRDALARSGDAAPSDLASELASFDGSLRADDHATAVVLAAVHHFLPSELFPVAAFGPIAAFPRVAAPAVGRILLAPSSPWFDDAAARDRVVAAALVRAAAWLSHAEATTGRRACEALFRSPDADPAGVEAGESAVAPPLGAAGSPAAVDWRGPSPPFLVGLAPTLRAGCRLAESTLRRATRAELAGATMAVPPPSRAPESGSGDFHSIDLAGPAGGEILDLVAGS